MHDESKKDDFKRICTPVKSNSMQQRAKELKDIMKKSIEKSPLIEGLFSADKENNRVPLQIGFGSSQPRTIRESTLASVSYSKRIRKTTFLVLTITDHLRSCLPTQAKLELRSRNAQTYLRSRTRLQWISSREEYTVIAFIRMLTKTASTCSAQTTQTKNPTWRFQFLSISISSVLEVQPRMAS